MKGVLNKGTLYSCVLIYVIKEKMKIKERSGHVSSKSKRGTFAELMLTSPFQPAANKKQEQYQLNSYVQTVGCEPYLHEHL